MPRYIDAEKIEIRVPYGYNNDGEVLVPIAAVNQAIARTPTEDVVKVVRCKDCVFSKNSGSKWHCIRAVRNGRVLTIYPSFFCASGKRKENTDGK